MKRRNKKHVITPEEMKATYRQCLARERIRERDWRKTRQGSFESSALHLDFTVEEANERDRSVSWLSDGGHGARKIYETLDPQPDPDTERIKRLDWAKHLVMRKAPDCLRVFWLIVKNGKNRKESIWQLVKHALSEQHKSGPKKPPSIGTN